MADTRLEQLDSATRSKLRSTQILTSLPQIISELIQNALDAEAKSVEAAVHCEDWSCWVRDDGVGINKDGLSLIAQGMEGGRYSSSKSYSPVSLDHMNTFGFRGEALASAADLSCIELSSRTSRSKESWSVILKGGEKLYYGPSLRWRRESAGTMVSIRDAFYNLPIRRLSHPNPVRTLELIRRELESLALVFPHVTFSLRDIAKENRDGVDRGRILTIPKTTSMLSTFRHLYGRAFVEHVDNIDAQSGPMKIEGFLSLIGSHSKSHQFLYVNRHIVDTCDLHRLIDQAFASSTFAKHALDETGENAPPEPGSRRSPRKSERRPVYVLNLTIPPRDVDNCLEPSKAAVHFQNKNAVASFLGDIIQSFLVRHGFKATQTIREAPPASKRRKVDASDRTHDYEHNDSSRQIPTSFPGLGKRMRSKEFFIRNIPLDDAEELTWVDPNSGQAYLVDARTGNSYLRDQRREDKNVSGSQFRLGRRTLVDSSCLNKAQSACHNSHCSERKGGEMPEWIRKALESNDSFAATERAIPQLPSSSIPRDYAPGSDSRRIPWTKQFEHTFSTLSLTSDNLNMTSPNCSFTKESLAGVQVLNQVDSKFIACLIDANVGFPSSGDVNVDESRANEEPKVSRSLVLVDQHAADERVRVERFLKPLCLGYLDRDGFGVERRILDPPVPVLLTKFERDRLVASAGFMKAFREWGIDINESCPRDEDIHCEEAESEEGYGMIYCSSVPEVVADKLLAGSADDLREVVKGYLARLEAEDPANACSGPRDSITNESYAGTNADTFAWLKALRHCPRELLELVNSRACRGAIMFNDALSVEQCKRLLRQLSMTAFPFQCAHGRPSVVPLTTIHLRRKSGSGEVGGTQGASRAVNWSNLT